MPAPRKPKKVFIQFAVALVIAGILGVGAIFAGLAIIGTVTSNAQKAQQQLEEERAEAERMKKKLAEEEARLRAEFEARNKQQNKVKYVTALIDLQPGQPITREMVTTVETEPPMPPGAVAQMSQVVGKMVKNPIYKDEPILVNNLLDSSGFINVKEGMRALTIKVDNIGALNGALTPGVKVDVLTTITNNEKVLTKTLLQNVEVVSVGDNDARAQSSSSSSGGSGGNNSVTLSVTPKQAEMLVLANKLGTFHLSLRNFKDTAKKDYSGADVTELLTGITAEEHKKSLPPPPDPFAEGMVNVNFTPEGGNLPMPEPPAAKKFSMQIYRGTGTETVEFSQ